MNELRNQSQHNLGRMYWYSSIGSAANVSCSLGSIVRTQRSHPYSGRSAHK
jgi:hypothetical protein